MSGLKIAGESLTIAGGTVTLECDVKGPEGIEALQSLEAAKMACQHAASKGVTKPGVSDSISVYPVDSEGVAIEDPGKMASMSAWRADIGVKSAVPC